MVSASRGGWLAVGICGAFLVIAGVYLPPAAGFGVWTLTQLGCLVLTVRAVARQRILHRSGWCVLVGANGIGVAGAALYLVPQYAQIEVAWVIALAARYVLFTVGLILLVSAHRDQSTMQTLLDGGIVAAGLAIVSWIFLVQPSLNGQPPDARNLGIAITFTALDLLLLSCLVRIMFGAQTVTTLLLAAGGVSVLAADMADATRMASIGLAGFQPGHHIHLAWQLCGVLTAAAALHPSVSLRHPAHRAPLPVTTRTLPQARLSIFLVMAVTAPAVPVIGLLTSGQFSRPYVVPALAGSAALTGLLLILLVIRLGLVARLANRRAQVLNAQAVELAARAEALHRALDEQQTLQRELAFRASHDALTGLANRALFAEQLGKAVLDPTDNTGALLLIDLDNFKDVNDTMGHQIGDELLVHVAQRLSQVAGPGDLVARLGGDEFALLLADSDATRCRHTANTAVEVLRRAYPLAGRQVQLAASGGLLLLEQPRGEMADALRDADLALYAAKESGKNQVIEFSPHMRQTRLRYAKTAAGLRTALVDDAFRVLYQPIIDLTTGRPVAVEALLRWRDAEGTMIAPNQFIPITEDIGLIVDIGAHVLRDACHQASLWHRRHGVAVSVNVSGRQLAEPSFADAVLDIVSDADIGAQALILEVAETVLVDHTAAGPERVLTDLHRLRGLGVRIAVDDFGTGHSPLSLLDRLPIDLIKIDDGFTRNLDQEGDRGCMLVAAMLSLGASLRVPAIAEGVETARQASLLRNLGCPLGQGYHFATPLPAVEMTRYLASAPQPAGAGGT